MFTVLSSWHKSLREFTQFIRRMQTSARQPPTLRPGQPTWAASPPVGCYIAYIHHCHFFITQLKSWYSFYRPKQGGRLSQPRHTACSPTQYYIGLHCTWVWETCPSNLAATWLGIEPRTYNALVRRFTIEPPNKLTQLYVVPYVHDSRSEHIPRAVVGPQPA